MSVKAYVPIQNYPEEEIVIAGRKEKASALSSAEVQAFVTQLDAIIHSQQCPVVKDIIARNARLLLDAIRVVNINTKQGFKGFAARGSELEINYVRPKTFNKTTWLQSIASAGTVSWLAETKALEEEALVILGWIDPIEVPKIDAVLYTKDGDPLPAQTLPFEVRDAFGTIKTPVVEQKLPITVLPEHKIKIDMNAFATGDDKIQPIAFHIRKAADFMTLPGPIFGTA